MAFSLRPRRRAEVPAEVLSRVDLLPKERLLAAAESRDPASWVLVGTARLYAVPHLGDVLARPWHLIDAGTWDHDNFTLTVTWVDGFRPQQWVFRDATSLLAAFRERVQASVVLTEVVPLTNRRQARVVIRKNLADGSLHDQTILGRGVRMADPEVAAAVGAARLRVREQVGL
jgi:hypothetical protein